MYGVQMDMLSMLGEKTETRDERMFREAVQRGSGVENSKDRIRRLVRDYEHDFDGLLQALRKEYGTGCCSMDGGYMDYGSKGLMITDWTIRWDDPEHGTWNNYKVTTYSWREVARKIIELIIMGQY